MYKYFIINFLLYYFIVSQVIDWKKLDRLDVHVQMIES